ncbi:hypothetical protein SDC9_210562 [bioreactor metagenome]|uniref:Uncharacterized protein n=1 Tax=bioreactor metagenome TaxID=1076179 RepID=A0A645JJD3_9ZZZZ
MAAVIGHVGAVEHGVDAPALGGELAQHLGVDGVERQHVEQAAPQAGLVGGHHHVPAGPVEPRHGLQRTALCLPLGGRGDVFLAQLVEGAVAVQDDDFHGRAPAGVTRQGGTGRPRGSWPRAAS